ncbi:MAG TPA: HAMP domain-containing sensor histidine kinase [Solirubrobacteraceae bacterium]
MSGPRSLSGRVTLAAVAAVGGALAVAGIAVVLASARSDRNALDRDLTRLAQRLSGPAGGLLGQGRPFPGGTVLVPRPPDDAFPDAGAGGDGGPLNPGADRFARVVRMTGVSYSGGAAVPARFPLPAASATPATVAAGGQDWRTVVRDLGGGARLQVAARMAPLQARASRLRLLVIASLLGALLATALLTRGLVQVALGPLARLRGTAGEVASTADLSVRVPSGAGPEEVDALAGDLNAMLARLEESAEGREAALQSARRFAADAGHELRTPLTSLRANLATGSVDAARHDADRLVALVEQLQALARGEAGPPTRVEPVDLGELADSAIVALKMRHPGLRTRLEAPSSGPVISGEPESLRMLVDNLLENAARHGRPDGTVAVTVALNGGATAEILVDDDGPGIPVAERAAVLERFGRGSVAHGPGTGLGLPIAAAQAARHGGALALEDAPLGGLRVRVWLAGAGTHPTPA